MSIPSSFDSQLIDWVSGAGESVAPDHPAWWSSAPYFQPSDKDGVQDCLDAAVSWESAPTDSWWDVECDKKKLVLCEMTKSEDASLDVDVLVKKGFGIRRGSSSNDMVN